MRRIAIVGAGQAGLQLALGLLAKGYQAVLISNAFDDPRHFAPWWFDADQCRELIQKLSPQAA